MSYRVCNHFISVNFINNLSISLVMIFGGILYMYSQSGAVKEASMFFITLGGIAKFVVPMCRTPMIYDKDLLLKGLVHLYKDNTRR